MGQTAAPRGAFTAALAATLRAERAAAQLTRQQVSDRSGVSLSTLLRLEKGDRTANVEHVCQVGGAMGMGPADLFVKAAARMEDQGRSRSNGSPSTSV